MKESQFEHFSSILNYKNFYENGYKTVDFELMGENCDCWPDQLQNDLENLYINQGLQFIGGYNKPGSCRELRFVMYNTMDSYNVTSDFDFVVEVLYGPVKDKKFESYLNSKYANDKYVYITTFSINRSSSKEELFKDPNLLVHLIIIMFISSNYLFVSGEHRVHCNTNVCSGFCCTPRPFQAYGYPSLLLYMRG